MCKGPGLAQRHCQHSTRQRRGLGGAVHATDMTKARGGGVTRSKSSAGIRRGERFESRIWVPLPPLRLVGQDMLI